MDLINLLLNLKIHANIYITLFFLNFNILKMLNHTIYVFILFYANIIFI